jgi:hypothetical protein
MFGIMQKEMKGTISREESIKQIDRLLDRILKAREVKELSKCVNTKCSKELSNTWTFAKADACKKGTMDKRYILSSLSTLLVKVGKGADNTRRGQEAAQRKANVAINYKASIFSYGYRY